MEKVKRLVEAGASVPTALKESLGTSVSAFAERHGLTREEVSGAVNLRIVPTPTCAHAFASAYGCPIGEFYEFWWTHARQGQVVAVAQ